MPQPNPTPPTRKRRKWLARLIVLFFGLLIGLLLAEFVVRLLYADRIVLFPRNHMDAQYGEFRIRRLRPSTTFRHTSADGSWLFTTNKQGYRDTRDWHYERTPNVGRVVVLGDSHMEGFEVRQGYTFSMDLEREMAARKMPTEVLNCGISGFGTAEELCFLENEGLRYKPDVVVMAFFGSDFDDNVKCGLYKLKDGALEVASKENIPGVSALKITYAVPGLTWLGEHSYLYSIVFNSIWDWQKHRQSVNRTAEAVPTESTISQPAKDAAAEKYREDLALALLARMHESCQKAGARLVVMEIPALTNAGPQNDPRTFTNSYPARLDDEVRKRCDVFLPAEEVFAEWRGVADLFVSHGQQHMSETAHLILAHAVAKIIAQPPAK